MNPNQTKQHYYVKCNFRLKKNMKQDISFNMYILIMNNFQMMKISDESLNIINRCPIEYNLI